MSKKIRRKALSVSMAGVLLLSVITPMPFSNPLQAAPAAAMQAAVAPAQVTADWYKSYQTMDGVGAAYAYTDSVHMLQLASAGHQDTVRHLLDLTFSEQKGTGHDIVRVIIGDNGGLTTSGATAASPGFNPLTSLLADVNNPGFDIEGNAIPMRGTAGQYGYKIEAENRYYDGNTDSIWPVEPEHAPGTLVPVQDFVWDYPSWNQPIGNDDGGPTNLLSKPGEQPVVIKNSPRTRKELFDIDQVWTMRQAQQYGVKQFYACTWTVPYWMSQSNTNSPSKIVRGDIATIGGKPVKIYYQAYADYLVNYIRGMWEQYGIPVTHINPFNEVDLAGGSAAYVTELINGYIGPALKKSMQPGGDLYDIKNPEGKLIDFIPQLAAVDGTNLGASLSRGGEVFSQTDPDNALDKNPYLDVFTTHLYGTVGIGTDENKLYHTGDFSKNPLDYTKDGSKYPEYLTKYKLWQAEFMNQDTGDGSAGAYTQRYGNQNINDAVRWSNLMTNMFTSNPGFTGFVWWSMWDSNGADGSDLIRFVTTNSQQEPGRISTLTGEYRLFKRFYSYGHFSRFMNPGDVRFEVTRVPAPDLNVVGFKNPATGDFSMTVSSANNDDSVQPLEFNLKDFPAGTDSVTVFRTSGSENQKKLGTIPVSGGKFVIDIPSASVVTVVPSKGTFATYQGLDGERDIFSTLEAEGNDNSVPGDSAGNAGRANEAVTLGAGGYLAYNNVNFADGSANGGVVRRHLLYLTAQSKSAQGGKLAAYVLPVGAAAGSSADILSQGTRVAEIPVPANDSYGKFQDMVDTGDLSAYGHKDLYIVAEPNGTAGTITVDRFLFGAGDSDWSTAANNSTVSLPGNLLLNGDFDTATASNTDNWSAGRYNKGTFEPAAAGPVLTADTIQSYSGLSRYLKNSSTSKVAGSGKLAGRIDAAQQYDGMWQDVTGKLNKGESYNFKGYFLSMMSRPDSYDVAAEHPGDVEAALVYYDGNGNQLGMTPINGRDMPEPYAAREAGDPAYWAGGKFVGRILEGGPLSLSSFQPVDVKVADWHETPNQPFTYEEPAGTAKVVLAVYAKDANILYADQMSLTPEAVVSHNLFIDGVQPSDFDEAKHEYKYTVTGNAIPKVTAVTSDPAELVSISQADSAQGTAVVRFVKGEQIKTYKIFFSTNEVIDFAAGLPAGWEVINPADPQTALGYSAEGAAIQTLKSDTDYPGSHNMLQLPGFAEGNWTLTAKLTVDKPLNDPSMGENAQVGLGISRITNGEFYRINARKVSSNIKVNNSGLIGTQPFTNNTNQTNLSGTNYFLRIVKEGNVVQGYFSTNSGASWLAMGNPSTYTPDFFKDAKVQLYGTNTSAVTDFKVTFSGVTLVKTLGETGEITADQQAVEEAAALIGNRITVPNAVEGEDNTKLMAKAQAILDGNEALKQLGVKTAITLQGGGFTLTVTKGSVSIKVSPFTVAAGMKAVRDFEDGTVQGFQPKGSAGVKLEVTKEANHTTGGAYALKVTGRAANPDGPAVQVKDTVTIGNEYKAAVWVKLISPASAQLKLTAQVNAPTPYYVSLATQTLSAGGDWVKLEGTYRYLHDDVTLYVESPNSTTASYYIDDFSFTDTGLESILPLQEVYKNDFLLGNIPGTNDLNPGNGQNAFFNYHFNAVTFENEMKPDALQKTKGAFTFNKSDDMVAKSRAMGAEVHGHVLVWHSQTPAWFTQQVDASGNAVKDGAGNPVYLSRSEALANMRTHILTVMEHYKDSVISWDVVNEAMQDGPPAVTDWKDALRKSPWYYSVGPDFIEQAFLAAREVLDEHPSWNIKLYYNDFNDDFPEKRDAIYDMVKEINDRYALAHPGKLLVDGIGLQSHYDMRTKPANVEAAIEKYASLGVELSISELDVLAGMNYSLSAEWAEKQANLYAQLFQIYKKHADVIARVTLWGYADSASWRAGQNPLPFISSLAPKPAYYAILDPEKYLAGHPLYVTPETKNSTALYGTPDIDGSVDDLWANAPEIRIDNHLMATAETTGTARTLWDEENLYVLFQVKDTQLSKASTDKTKQDSVEAYVDEDRINAWPYREDDGQYRVNYAGEQSFKFLSNSTPAVSPGFESAAVTEGTAYTVEMKIPFRTLRPENGTQIRFDAQVNNATGSNLIGVATWNDLLGRAAKSTEVFGNLTLSGKGDAAPPVWAEGSKLEATGITPTGVTLSWPAAMDNLGVTGYRIYNGIDSEPVLVTGIEPVETATGAVYRYEAAGLLPNTSYTFKVEAGDAAGNWSKDGPYVIVTTLPGEDITPPVWAEGSTLAASGITSSGLTLTWSATATDDSGIYGYRITNGTGDKPITVTDAVYTETVTGAVYSHQVTGLQPGKQYTFKVEAGDTGGNWSEGGPSVSATTLPATDTTPPVWMEGSKLEASRITASGLTLTWTRAANDTGVTGYKVYRGAEEIAALSGTELRYEVTGLAAGTEYHFSVQAGDEAGNWSKNGPALSVTTLKDSGGPSEPTPTPTTRPTPTPTPVPTSVPTSTATPTPTPTSTPGATGTPAASQTPAPTQTPVPSSPFKDVGAKYSWASEAIDTLYSLGIIQGTSAVTFSPEKNITRADFVLLVVRALGLEAESGSGFADVSQGAYYYEALSIAKQLGIINGTDGSNFNPKGEISRQDMMVIAARALKVVNKLSAGGSAGDLAGYTDRMKVAKYAIDSVAALVQEGIVRGDGKSLHPTGTATRAEAAVMIFRILKK
ncbi:endo-1,4-beta-xylanase [Paenibacillus sp. FSL R7-0210]|uniref:endo-1,4-beta-xylanase n=1 Tax=Paenibacillus sp. FSL R7-0210 TaxID=2921676 RepID=UPI0030F9B643